MERLKSHSRDLEALTTTSQEGGPYLSSGLILLILFVSSNNHTKTAVVREFVLDGIFRDPTGIQFIPDSSFHVSLSSRIRSPQLETTHDGRKIPADCDTNEDETNERISCRLHDNSATTVSHGVRACWFALCKNFCCCSRLSAFILLTILFFSS